MYEDCSIETSSETTKYFLSNEFNEIGINMKVWLQLEHQCIESLLVEFLQFFAEPFSYTPF